MKTISISIGDALLEHVDQLRARDERSRSEVIRVAVEEYVARLERAAEEEREREIFRRNRSRLNRQAALLVKDQARL